MRKYRWWWWRWRQNTISTTNIFTKSWNRRRHWRQITCSRQCHCGVVENNDEDFEAKPDGMDAGPGRLVGIVSVEMVIAENGNASPSYKMDKRSWIPPTASLPPKVLTIQSNIAPQDQCYATEYLSKLSALFAPCLLTNVVQEDQNIDKLSAKRCGIKQRAVCYNLSLSGANYNIISSKCKHQDSKCKRSQRYQGNKNSNNYFRLKIAHWLK